jgi:signal transduction histidine kinase
VVEDLLRSVVMPFKLLLEPARVSLELVVEPDVPLVLADLHLVRRTLSNLVDNAIKFTPDGGHVEVWARLDGDRAPGEVLIGVTDSGPGIAPEDQERLFLMYQQSGSAGRRPGSGVGLAFCKLAVEAHGGRIWIESEPGRGSTFLLTLDPVGEVGAA